MQMPGGVPVATSPWAAEVRRTRPSSPSASWLLQNADLARKMDQFRAGMADTVRAKDKRPQERLSSWS
ncbi:MAG: hypothetical protein R3E96_04975 [Planctomycetota bacterium]